MTRIDHETSAVYQHYKDEHHSRFSLPVHLAMVADQCMANLIFNFREHDVDLPSNDRMMALELEIFKFLLHSAELDAHTLYKAIPNDDQE